MPAGQAGPRHRLAAAGVALQGGEQPQLVQRRGRVTAPGPLLLPGDQRGGGLGDRQPPPHPPGLVVVVDEHREAVAVAGQAVPGQRADLVGAPPGIDDQLDDGADADPVLAFQRGELVAQLPHDLRRQVPGRSGMAGQVGDVAGGHREVIGQPGGGAAGAGQAHRADAGQDQREVAAGHDPGRVGQRARVLLAAEPVQQRLDVGPAERTGNLAAILAQPQRL